MTYSDKLKSPKWQKKRLEILNRDEFTCKCCGDTETELQVHHKKYEAGKQPWEANNEDLVTICRHCHAGWHHAKQHFYESDMIGFPKVLKLKNRWFENNCHYHTSFMVFETHSILYSIIVDQKGNEEIVIASGYSNELFEILSNYYKNINHA